MKLHAQASFNWGVFIISLIAFIAAGAISYFSIPTSGHGVDLYLAVSMIGFFFGVLVLFSRNISRYGLNCLTIALFFFLWFYGFIPFLVYLSGYWLYGDISVNYEPSIVAAQLDGWLFLVFMLVSYRCARRCAVWFWDRIPLSCKYREIRPFTWLVACFLQLAIGGILLKYLGFKSLLYRGSDQTVEIASFSVVILLHLLRPLTFFIFCVYLIGMRNKWTGAAIVQATISGILALLCNFPLSLSRTNLFMLIVTFIFSLIYTTKYWKWISLAIIILGFVGSIFTDRFRELKSSKDLHVLFQPVDIGHYLTVGQFDAFEMNVYTNRFYQDNGPLHGRQILGTLFFYVPRLLWTNKPDPTGVLLGSSYINILESTSNTNLSCPLPAEGLIDFGVFGVCLYGVMAGFLFSIVDRFVFIAGEIKTNMNNVVGGLYFSCIVGGSIVGSELLILRGSLLPAFAYLVGAVLAATIAVFIFTKPAILIVK